MNKTGLPINRLHNADKWAYTHLGVIRKRNRINHPSFPSTFGYVWFESECVVIDMHRISTFIKPGLNRGQAWLDSSFVLFGSCGFRLNQIKQTKN